MKKTAKLAMENVPAKFRGVVVTAARAKWKRRHQATPRQQRMLRFIWMRNIPIYDMEALNWIDLGGLWCRGWLKYKSFEATGGQSFLALTYAGEGQIGVS